MDSDPPSENRHESDSAVASAGSQDTEKVRGQVSGRSAHAYNHEPKTKLLSQGDSRHLWHREEPHVSSGETL